MGTRGAIGFISDNKVKTTYNHSDSYPDWLGKEIFEQVNKLMERGTPISELKKVVAEMKLFDDDIILTYENIDYFFKSPEEITDVERDNLIGTDLNLYSHIREHQGNLLFNLDNGYMIGYEDGSFLEDSLFCEWGYIVNLDEETLEVYRGFNQEKPTHGYYAKNDYKLSSEYHPCKLIASFALNQLKEFEVDEFVSEIEKCAEEGYEYYDSSSINVEDLKIQNS